MNKKDKKVTYRLTDKGTAYYLACVTGLCPKINGGYDTTNFDKFWEEFEPIIQDKNEAIKIYRKGFRNFSNCYLTANIAVAVVNLLFLIIQVLIRCL